VEDVVISSQTKGTAQVCYGPVPNSFPFLGTCFV
jgi:hypothetical protein